jgi:hypothetical protein
MGLIAETFDGTALRIARHVQWLTVNPEEHRQCGELGVVLPFPPSMNHLWKPIINYRGGYAELVKTDEYNGWWYEAGYSPTLGRWARFSDSIKPTKAKWGMVCVAVGMHYGRDASNVFKAAEDLVCAMCNLADRYNMTPSTLRLDLSRELRKEGLIEGLYVLVELLEEEK